MAVSNSLCISTVIDSKYQSYIPLFVYSLQKSYPEYHIKLFTHGMIKSNVLDALHVLKSDVEITEGLFDDWKHSQYAPISWRFVIPPKFYKGFEYVYVTDIDMVIMPEKVELLNFHLNEMGETGLCYSNSLRNSKHWKGGKSFSGLHFVSQEWFEVTEESRRKYAELIKTGGLGSKREFDGHLLWLMAKDSGLKMCKKYPLATRHHGCHMGNFRLFKTMVKLKKRMGLDKCLKWQEYQRDPLFRRICNSVSCDNTVKEQLRLLDEHCKKVIK